MRTNGGSVTDECELDSGATSTGGGGGGGGGHYSLYLPPEEDNSGLLLLGALAALVNNPKSRARKAQSGGALQSHNRKGKRCSAGFKRDKSGTQCIRK